MKRDDEAFLALAAGLRNAHAMEKQALSVLKPQAARIDDYPDMQARIARHIAETEGQIERLDAAFALVGEKRSGLRDMVLSLGGAMAALGHIAADDEVLKDVFANYAFEHYEIAAYKSLIQISDRLGLANVALLLRQNLDEEERMAQWLDEHVGLVTEQYLALREAEPSGRL
ncbi:ferritin-like domain-containing protein [Pelagibacterium lacus]|uniref:Ferritin-like domain-containing protein n=1 Tax=Pelagibacterium lacus TaxID=2282655 RepID=A0A369W2C4_9HYPH|nr:ferritin-like domain-containing protein [Pelagibacterium lacus]RDE08097.1 ferritin-like domain-containing protein [Pelagibacterium lacus]